MVKKLFTGFGEGTSSTGSTACVGASTAGSTARTATAAARSRSAKTGKTLASRRPRLPHQAGHRRARSRRPARRSRAASATTGATGSAATTATSSGTTSSTTTTCAATRTSAARQTRPASRQPGAAPVFPLSRTLPRFNDLRHGQPLHRRRAASASTATTCSGRTSPATLFICEPVHNLVHRMVLEADGADVHRPPRRPTSSDREFLASTDNWFRPAMARTGPGRCLWVADMYRAVIEHPHGSRRDWQKQLDLRAGHDMGRIYRVYPGRHASRGRSRGSTSSTRPAWSRRSTAPTAGSATWRR